jgi:hypothetical protein
LRREKGAATGCDLDLARVAFRGGGGNWTKRVGGVVGSGGIEEPGARVWVICAFLCVGSTAHGQCRCVPTGDP